MICLWFYLMDLIDKIYKQAWTLLKTQEINFPRVAGWVAGWLAGWVLGGWVAGSVGESGNKANSASWSWSLAELGNIIRLINFLFFSRATFHFIIH